MYTLDFMDKDFKITVLNMLKKIKLSENMDEEVKKKSEKWYEQIENNDTEIEIMKRNQTKSGV